MFLSMHYVLGEGSKNACQVSLARPASRLTGTGVVCSVLIHVNITHEEI